MRSSWAIFLSGQGSTAQAVLDLLDQVLVGLVVSSKASAPGLARAKRCGIPTSVLTKSSEGRVDWEAVQKNLESYRITQIFLLGFMKLLPASFLDPWQGRIWNVHPSLLPAYPGLHSIERALADGNPIGVTIHDVVPEMDAGPIRLQKSLGILPAGIPFEHARLEVAKLEQSLIQNWVKRVEEARS